VPVRSRLVPGSGHRSRAPGLVLRVPALLLRAPRALSVALAHAAQRTRFSRSLRTFPGAPAVSLCPGLVTCSPCFLPFASRPACPGSRRSPTPLPCIRPCGDSSLYVPQCPRCSGLATALSVAPACPATPALSPCGSKWPHRAPGCALSDLPCPVLVRGTLPQVLAKFVPSVLRFPAAPRCFPRFPPGLPAVFPPCSCVSSRASLGGVCVCPQRAPTGFPIAFPLGFHKCSPGFSRGAPSVPPVSPRFSPWRGFSLSSAARLLLSLAPHRYRRYYPRACFRLSAFPCASDVCAALLPFLASNCPLVGASLGRL